MTPSLGVCMRVLDGVCDQRTRMKNRGCLMKKSDCTEEQWAAYKAKNKAWRIANIERERERQRTAYQQDPEKRAKAKAYRDQPEVKARKNAIERARHAAKRAASIPRYSPEETQARTDRQRKARTGMDAATRTEMFALQDGRCAICARSFDGRQVRADHCHDSGTPRGLLCHHCNIIEGMIRSMGIAPTDFGSRLEHYLKNPPFQRFKSAA